MSHAVAKVLEGLPRRPSDLSSSAFLKYTTVKISTRCFFLFEENVFCYLIEESKVEYAVPCCTVCKGSYKA